MESLGETKLQITLGKHQFNQTFLVVSSLIESCIPGVNVLFAFALIIEV